MSLKQCDRMNFPPGKPVSVPLTPPSLENPRRYHATLPPIPHAPGANANCQLDRLPRLVMLGANTHPILCFKLHQSYLMRLKLCQYSPADWPFLDTYGAKLVTWLKLSCNHRTLRSINRYNGRKGKLPRFNHTFVGTQLKPHDLELKDSGSIENSGRMTHRVWAEDLSKLGVHSLIMADLSLQRPDKACKRC